ncbi:MAG: PAS domain S-box protein [Dehalococcoidia bacterium]|jgi:PAS domain S-box-containing protein
MKKDQLKPKGSSKGTPASKPDNVAQMLSQIFEKSKQLRTFYDLALQINGLLLSVKNETDLFQKICDALIHIDFIRFVWIGLADKTTFSIKPVANAGIEEGYLSKIKVTFDDTEGGKGPTGATIRSGQPNIVNDTQNDKKYILPWRDEALKRGYLSSIAIPLVHEKEIIGTLNVYSGTKDAFNDDEIKFLSGVGQNISTGINSLRAEEALDESERRFQRIIEHVNDIFYILDPNLEIVYVSPHVESALGYTVAEALNSWRNYVTDNPMNLAAYEKTQMALTTGEKQLPYLQEFMHRDGTKRLAEINESPLKNYKGEVIGIVGAARDMTERKKAEEALKKSEEKFRILSEKSITGIYIIQDAKMAYVNPSLASMFGYSPEEITGKLSLVDLIHPDDIQAVMERLQNRLAGEIEHGSIVYKAVKKDGATIHIEVYGMLIEYQGRPAVMGTLIDITESKVTEEKLLKSYESLKKTLNDAINTMVKIVEMRDPYTAGHQQRVADLATTIATEMKLEDTRIDQLRMAAIIHDIGKIFVPSDILSKPGKLTDMEFRLVKTHSQHGYDIVKGMDLPGSVAQAVLQHHERLDGSGYPNQLKGGDILLEAKILAIADVVEAMSSHRPFRSALGIDKAFEEIAKNKGKLYDPDVVDICLTVFNTHKFEFKPV